MPFRPPVLGAVAGAVALLAPAVASAATPTSAATDPGPRPTLAAKLTACEPATDVAGGSAAFTASMPARRGASRLWIRFALERQAPGRRGWERVAAPTFGEWEKSRPGVSGFVYAKRVEGLAPGAYRAVVRFRWVDAEGRTVRRAQRTTPACRQPDPRPNLELVRLRPAMGDGGPVAEVTVRNGGRTDTLAPAVVTLRVAGVEQPSQTVPPLGPGVTAIVTFPLAGCAPGQELRAEVDPADGIDEASETDNVAVRPCG